MEFLSDGIKFLSKGIKLLSDEIELLSDEIKLLSDEIKLLSDGIKLLFDEFSSKSEEKFIELIILSVLMPNSMDSALEFKKRRMKESKSCSVIVDDVSGLQKE